LRVSPYASVAVRHFRELIKLVLFHSVGGVGDYPVY